MIFYETDYNRMKTLKKIFGGDVQFLTNHNLFTFGISFCFSFHSFFFCKLFLRFFLYSHPQYKKISK